MTFFLISDACGRIVNAPARGIGVHCFDNPFQALQNSGRISELSVLQC
jgi:hypothetical protein